jgi:hypothetical protein
MGKDKMKKKTSHTLHSKVGDILRNQIKNEADGISVFCDSDCGGDQYVSLFINEKDRKNRMCLVDAMIAKDNKVKVIIEVEESDNTPVRIFGKYLASAFSKYYIRGKDKKDIDDKSVLFIQIIVPKGNQNNSKKEQAELIEAALRDNPVGCIKEYNLFCVEDKNIPNSFVQKIKDFLYGGSICP